MVLSEEVCASGMGQRSHTNDVTVKGVQIKPKVEECATDMEQRSIDATVKDVQIMLSKEECA